MLFQEKIIFDKNSENNEYSFYSTYPVELLNSVRRILMKNYKTYAISDDIKIIKNTSIMNDDIIRHRISQIPIFCQSEIELELNIKNVNDDRMVEIESHNFRSFNKDVFKITENIPITKLKKNEEVYLKIKTDYHSGNYNIRYRPTNVIICKKIKILKHNINDEELVNDIFIFMENSYDMKKENYLNDKNIVGVLDTAKTNLDYVSIIKKELELPDSIELYLEDYIIENKYVRFYSIETTGFKDPKKIFSEGLNMLIKNLKDGLQKKILKRKQEETKYFYEIKNECATIGNIIQFFLNKKEEVEYSYFIKKTPFDTDIELQIFLIKNCNKNIDIIFLELDKEIEKYFSIFL